jgi:hypothetical protein
MAGRCHADAFALPPNGYAVALAKPWPIGYFQPCQQPPETNGGLEAMV